MEKKINIAVYIVLVLSDLVDGPLARWMNQQSAEGAFLDSVADATLNACLLCGAVLLCWDQVKGESLVIGFAVLSYVVAISFGLWKFGRVTSYHTVAAKMTQWLAALAAIALILQWSIWPLRVAAIAACLTNLEILLITGKLKKPESDIPTIFKVWHR